MSDEIVDQIVDQHYGPTREDRMDAVREEVQAVLDDPAWSTGDGFRAMVPKPLLVKLLANDPDAEVSQENIDAWQAYAGRFVNNDLDDPFDYDDPYPWDADKGEL